MFALLVLCRLWFARPINGYSFYCDRVASTINAYCTAYRHIMWLALNIPILLMSHMQLSLKFSVASSKSIGNFGFLCVVLNWTEPNSNKNENGSYCREWCINLLQILLALSGTHRSHDDIDELCDPQWWYVNWQFFVLCYAPMPCRRRRRRCWCRCHRGCCRYRHHIYRLIDRENIRCIIIAIHFGSKFFFPCSIDNDITYISITPL